jgi:hypothetical protein
LIHRDDPAPRQTAGLEQGQDEKDQDHVPVKNISHFDRLLSLTDISFMPLYLESGGAQLCKR